MTIGNQPPGQLVEREAFRQRPAQLLADLSAGHRHDRIEQHGHLHQRFCQMAQHRIQTVALRFILGQLERLGLLNETVGGGHDLPGLFDALVNRPGLHLLGIGGRGIRHHLAK